MSFEDFLLKNLIAARHVGDKIYGSGMQVLSFLDDIFPALLSSLSDTSDEVGPPNLSTSFLDNKKLKRMIVLFTRT